MLERFTIFHKDEAQRISMQIPIILNLNHIVSIKPIKMAAEDRKVIDGFWIRLSNGKKYKATSIPLSIRKIINSNESTMVSIGNQSKDISTSLQ